MKRFIINIFILLTAALNTSGLRAEPADCRASLASRAVRVSQREKLLRIVKAKDIPAFIKETPHGPLPVILMTKDSAESLREYMENSVGAGILLRWNPELDHGLFRIGGVKLNDGPPENLMLDWATPETRNRFEGDVTEIHGTGLAWRSLDERLRRSHERDSYPFVSVELSLRVTKAEKDSLEYYHRIRRATLIGLPDPNSQGEMRPEVPNQIYTGEWEGCFNYCMGTSAPLILTELEKKLRTAGVINLPHFLRRPTTAAFLARARDFIMNTGACPPALCHHQMIMESPELAPAARALFPELDKEALENAVNSLISFVATKNALDVYRKLGLGADPAARVNFDNPRVSAVLIYTSPRAAPAFRNATFTAPGAYDNTGWGEDAAGTVPFRDQHPLAAGARN